MSEKIIFVCINKSFERFSSGIIIKGRENLYQCTRKYWPVKLWKANEAEYIGGVSKGIIKSIYRQTDAWKPVRSFSEFLTDAEIIENPSLLNRYAFTGIEAPQSIRAKYIGSKIPQEFRFYGNIVSYNF